MTYINHYTNPDNNSWSNDTDKIVSYVEQRFHTCDYHPGLSVYVFLHGKECLIVLYNESPV